MELSKKRVLVTGAAGFIGSHLVEGLLQERCKIRAFVRYNSFGSWGWLDTFDKDKLRNIDVIQGDVGDQNVLRKAMKDVEVVFHLAALVGIPFSYHSPDSYVATNIGGTMNVLQTSRNSQVEKVLVTSTSEVYGTARYVPIDEKHPRHGQSPYSATKIAADCLAESFFASFDLPVVIVRPFNTYGPRQSARAVIPAIITQLLSGKHEIQLGALHPTRDFVYVKDAVNGFIQIAKSDRTIGEEINIATQTEISVRDIAKKLISMINPDAKIGRDSTRLRPAKSEVERLLGNNEKIKKLTDWKPKYTIEEGLKETIQWFKNKEHLKLYKPDIYNV